MAELKGITPRKYQKEIAEAVLRHGNTLIVLPTGLGKTLILIMIAIERLKEGKILFLAPTKPLVKQHYETIMEKVEGVQPVIITGEVPKKKRKELWENSNFIIATPQTVEHDLGVIDPREYALLIIDEAHRAVGKYAYTTIAERFKPYSWIVGATASPGGDGIKIQEIREKLGINHVEMRDLEDPEIKEYFPGIKIQWVRVSLTPEYREAIQRLDRIIQWYQDRVRDYGFKYRLRSRKEMIVAKDLIARSSLNTKYHALKYLSAAINLDYAREMLEIQSMEAFLKYIENLKTRDTKSAKLIAKDRRVEELVQFVEERKRIHPKLQKLVDIIKEKEGKKFIVFSQYVSQVEYIEYVLNMYDIKAHKFVGQRKGFTRKKQLEVLDRFREGEFDVLVASSVGEEGLDIPTVDYVIFYEPVPSEIRSIQRRGRTGRHREGNAIILITRGTRDEAYYYSARSKEKKMKKLIKIEGKKEVKKGLKDWFN